MFNRSFGLGILAAVLLSGAAQAEYPFSQVTLIDLEGKAFTSDRLKGKVTVVVIANRDTAEEGYKVGRELRINFDKSRNFLCIPLLNLKAAPSFVHDQILKDTRLRIQKEELALKGQLGKAASAPIIVLPDWDGSLVLSLWQASPLPEFAVFRQDPAQASRFDRSRLIREQQRLANPLQIFILNKAGEIKAHFLGAESLGSVLSTTRKLLEETR